MLVFGRIMSSFFEKRLTFPGLLQLPCEADDEAVVDYHLCDKTVQRGFYFSAHGALGAKEIDL